MKRAPRPRLATAPTARPSAALLHALLAVLLIAFSAAALAATPAGTVITNQATALAGGRTYRSNLVETVVLPVCSVTITPDGTPAQPGQTVDVVLGGTAYLPYRILNTGNASARFDLTLQQDPSSEWTPVASTLYLDEDCNGRLDPADPAVTAVDLAAGEEACLLVSVQAPDQGRGDLYISPVAACPQGTSDRENYGRVHLLGGPQLQVDKSMTPTRVLPGDLVRVSLSVRNAGDAPAEPVTLSDDLAPLAAAGARYEPSSARAAKGTVEFSDGGGWTTREPASVSGIRLVLDRLDPGETAVLVFYLRVADDAAAATVRNRAVAEGPGGPAEGTAEFEIAPRYEHFLGPRGNPRALPGGEGSPDDLQEVPYLIAGQTYCFEHTLENASTAADDFDLSVSGLPEGVEGAFYLDPDTPLESPVHLEAGASLDFLFCVVAEDVVPPFTADLVATSAASGASNHTYDRVKEVWPADALAPTKRVDPEGTVTAGSELVYTLHFENGYPIDLTHVVIEDPLDEHLEYVASDPEGSYDPEGHLLRWTLETLPSGAGWTATVTVRVKQDTPDDVIIENAFTVRSDQLPDPVASDPTRTPVWSSQLLLQKEVSPAEVRLGELLHYVLTVHNPSNAAMTVTVTDIPAAGLRYVAGSGTPLEPEQQDDRLVWADLRLEGGETLVLEYDMRVLPGASGELVNVAVAEGTASGSTATARSRATARARLAEGAFLPRRATLVGRVFLDADRDGRYDPGRDVPLPGARLLLPDGTQVRTDVVGNYAFRDIEAGVWQVVLDPQTAPFPPLPHPEALGDGYRHRVYAWGLTVSDFPLAAPAGVIEATRSTSLFFGPLRVDKHLIPLGEGRVRVVLHLVSSTPLPELTLRDPLPEGGEKIFDLGTFEGEKTLTYDLEVEGRPVLTDPEVRWRYP